ncbi:MAG: CRISPR system precrRNA processing endoribonuclease RAMP protein Cas6 [Chloroflexi bacterium]|nr:CRISPR system precrRNA processing endoribonuclease RAMP protein Cas6 [Chloroflexota bacterium]
METLTAHVLRFEGEVETMLRLPALKGSALRGALFNALRRHFCVSPRACRGDSLCALPAMCPAGLLLAPTDPEGPRGSDPPRPFVLNPPLDSRLEYRPGDRLTFSLTTFGRALNQFPHTLIAVNEMGRAGLGAVTGRETGETGRGRFRLRAVWASHPLDGQEQRVYWDRDPVVQVPRLPVTHADILGHAHRLGEPKRLALRLRTPLRLVERGRLLQPQELHFRTLFLRLHERLAAIAQRYCGGPAPAALGDLLALADEVTIADADLAWVEVDRYSSRAGRRLPMDGIVGRVTFAGPLAPFLPYLVWGEISHVGRYAVFGHGWYELGEG